MMAATSQDIAASQQKLDAAIATILRETGVDGPDRVAQTMHRLQQAYYCSDVLCPYRRQDGVNFWPRDGGVPC